MIELVVNVDVADLERAIAFYTDGMGLRLARRLGPDIAELAGAPVPLHLIRVDAGVRPFAGATALRGFARHWTPVHLDFVVADLEAAVARAEAAGAVREGGARSFPGGRLQVLADPFGHGLCLVELSGRGYAELEERPYDTPDARGGETA